MSPLVRPCIVVHGGAGDEVPPFAIEELVAGVRAAARVGGDVLARGGSALDAVEEAAANLEDNPLFNAGRGSVLNQDGEVEMDASVMEGAHLRAGAVASVQGIQNVIRLARKVMEKTEHVLLVAHGAHAFAREMGVAFVSKETLITPHALAKWKQQREQGAKPSFGTIGAVAVDAQGHVAAATSTGGTSFKRAGRVGDTPLIGAGTYADDEAGAVSATGHGEAIIRVSLAKTACELLRSGHSPMAAAEKALQSLVRIQGSAGLIVVSPTGEPGWAFNTRRMARAWIRGDGDERAAYFP